MEKKSIDHELEEMRCLIEAQQREIYRQQHRVELQRERLDYIQAELDVINGGAPHEHGNGNGNGTRHRVARSPRSEPDSSSRRT